MVAESSLTIRYRRDTLSYPDACALCERVRARGEADLVCLDLAETTDTTTAALAKLIVLRRDLLRTGRDLRIIGLAGRAQGVYEISRLDRILPRCEAVAR